MIVHNVVQGSAEWLQLRLGKPTASEFGKIITPKGKVSTQAENYLRCLCAEILIGHPLEHLVMPWMDRGHQLEEEAVSFYELQTGNESVPVGFVTNDEGTIGASPDRLVGEEGELEIKCPAPQTHVGYMLFDDGVDNDYYPQVQGQLYVTGRVWADVVSYHPSMRSVIIRVERNEEYIEKMAAMLEAFVGQLKLAADRMVDRGYLTREQVLERTGWGGYKRPEPPNAFDAFLNNGIGRTA